MDRTDQQYQAQYPLVRITTLGEFALERLVRAPSLSADQPPRYERVAQSEWSNRGPAMALLKVLLCRANRRAARDELIEAIWPGNGQINAAHALDSAASLLRRHILRAGEVGSLLLTLRSGGETIFKLAGQQHLWVDADALLSLASQAMRAECQGQNPLPLLEEAHALARGEFLEDDPYAEWAQGRRHTINGARHRVLFKLVDLYIRDERASVAEELLFAALEEDPTDEDALCRLMVLLVEQERRQEALQPLPVCRGRAPRGAGGTGRLHPRTRAPHPAGAGLAGTLGGLHRGGGPEAFPGGAGCDVEEARGRLGREVHAVDEPCCRGRRPNAHPVPLPSTAPQSPETGSAPHWLSQAQVSGWSEHLGIAHASPHSQEMTEKGFSPPQAAVDSSQAVRRLSALTHAQHVKHVPVFG